MGFALTQCTNRFNKSVRFCYFLFGSILYLHRATCTFKRDIGRTRNKIRRKKNKLKINKKGKRKSPFDVHKLETFSDMNDIQHSLGAPAERKWVRECACAIMCVRAQHK